MVGVLFNPDDARSSKNPIISYAYGHKCFNNPLDTSHWIGECIGTRTLGGPQTLKHSLKN